MKIDDEKPTLQETTPGKNVGHKFSGEHKRESRSYSTSVAKNTIAAETYGLRSPYFVSSMHSLESTDILRAGNRQIGLAYGVDKDNNLLNYSPHSTTVSLLFTYFLFNILKEKTISQYVSL